MGRILHRAGIVDALGVQNFFFRRSPHRTGTREVRAHGDLYSSWRRSHRHLDAHGGSSLEGDCPLVLLVIGLVVPGLRCCSQVLVIPRAIKVRRMVQLVGQNGLN